MDQDSTTPDEEPIVGVEESTKLIVAIVRAAGDGGIPNSDLEAAYAVVVEWAEGVLVEYAMLRAVLDGQLMLRVDHDDEPGEQIKFSVA